MSHHDHEKKENVTQFTVRTASKEDLAAVIDLGCESITYSLSPCRDTSPEALKAFRRKDFETLKDALGSDTLGIFVAEDPDHTILGHVVVVAGVTEATTGEVQGWILDLSVKEERWGRGVGTALTRRAEEFVRDKGLQYLGLSVTTANERAVKFYDALGYQEERKRMIKRVG